MTGNDKESMTMKPFLMTLALVGAVAALAVPARAQAPSQYRTTHVTNASVTVIQENITKTNLVVFSTAPARRYVQLTFVNIHTNPVYLQCVTGNRTNWFSGQTNDIKNAGGIRLAPRGTSGDRVTYNLVIPNNGTVAGAGSISFAAQTGDGDPAITGKLNVEGLGF